jgi:glycogen debranching enzyme
MLRGKMTDDGAWEVELPPYNPGVISFQLVFIKGTSTVTVAFGSSDVILLCQDKYDLRKLRKMTVFPRCIGPHTDWEAFFDSQHDLGYNAFHFAPIQQTGASNSYYSLKSQL